MPVYCLWKFWEVSSDTEQPRLKGISFKANYQSPQWKPYFSNFLIKFYKGKAEQEAVNPSPLPKFRGLESQNHLYILQWVKKKNIFEWPGSQNSNVNTGLICLKGLEHLRLSLISQN